MSNEQKDTKITFHFWNIYFLQLQKGHELLFSFIVFNSLIRITLFLALLWTLKIQFIIYAKQNESKYKYLFEHLSNRCRKFE